MCLKKPLNNLLKNKLVKTIHKSRNHIKASKTFSQNDCPFQYVLSYPGKKVNNVVQVQHGFSPPTPRSQIFTIIIPTTRWPRYCV